MTDEQKAAETERLRFEGDLDKWMKMLGAGISGYQPEAYAVMDDACRELVKLRSDALSARLADAVQPAAGEGGLREALEKIAAGHVPDQPASSPLEEADYVRRHVASLRRIAVEVLSATPALISKGVLK